LNKEGSVAEKKEAMKRESERENGERKCGVVLIRKVAGDRWRWKVENQRWLRTWLANN